MVDKADRTKTQSETTVRHVSMMEYEYFFNKDHLDNKRKQTPDLRRKNKDTVRTKRLMIDLTKKK